MALDQAVTAAEPAPGAETPSAGSRGVLELSFARRGDRSVLAGLYRRAPLLVQQALYWDEELPGLPCVYVITTSGCILQGDRLDIAIDVGERAAAHVTAQAATKVHRMDADVAIQRQQVTLADGAYLELLPGPVIMHRGARLISQTRVTVAETATLISAEVLRSGRKHHNHEVFEFDLYDSTTSATRPDGARLFTERLVAEPLRRPVRQAGAMGGYDVLANVLVVTPRPCAEAVFERVTQGFDDHTNTVAGASRLPHDAGLVYKVLGAETEPVQAKVRSSWGLVREAVVGAALPAPRSWR